MEKVGNKVNWLPEQQLLLDEAKAVLPTLHSDQRTKYKLEVARKVVDLCPNHVDDLAVAAVGRL